MKVINKKVKESEEENSLFSAALSRLIMGCSGEIWSRGFAAVSQSSFFVFHL